MRHPQSTHALLWRLLCLYWQRPNRGRWITVGVAATAALGVVLMVPRSSPMPTSAGTTNGATARPAAPCADVRTLLAALEAKQQIHEQSLGESDLVAVHEVLDQLALAVLCSRPAASPAELTTVFGSSSQLTRYDLDIRALAPGKLLFLWSRTSVGPVRVGGRATVFELQGSSWTALAHFDFDDVWSPYIGGIRPDGVALLDAVTNGCGSPPSRLVALAVAGNSLLVHDSGPVPSLEIDEEHSPTVTRTMRNYPFQPLLQYAVDIERAENELAVTERVLTPWTVALDEFCGGDRDIALPAVLAPVDAAGPWPGRITADQCDYVSDVRVADDVVEADLSLHIDWEWRDATVTLKELAGRWRIVGVR